MKDIHARAPINRTAARVTSSGEHYRPKNSITEQCSDVPLPTRPAPKPSPNWQDLTGTRCGTLTVIGLAVEKEGGSGGKCKWVCRCVCGRYVHRKTRVIKRAIADDCCAMCHNVRNLRKQSTFAATGRYFEREEP